MDDNTASRLNDYLRVPLLGGSPHATRDQILIRVDRAERRRIRDLVAGSISSAVHSEIAASRRVAYALLDARLTPGPFGRIVRRQEASVPGTISVVAETLVAIALDPPSVKGRC